MALTVQNDEGTIEDANAYISVDYFKAYHDERLNPYEDYDDGQIAAAIIKASDYVDTSFTFRGQSLKANQATQFPRIRLTDSNGDSIEGIPLRFKQGIAEYALRALNAALAPDAVYESGGGQISEVSKKVGPIEKTVKYINVGAVTLRRYPAADRLIELYTRGSVSFGVYRG